MSFLFFSDFHYGKIFNKNNNINIWDNNIMNKKESSSQHKNILWFYTCVIYLIGGIVFYFIKYFAKRYIEPSCPSINK